MATRWRLDTCNCEFQYEDADNLEGTAKFLKKCKYHTRDTVMTVVEENRGKNRAVAKLVDRGIDPHTVGFEFEKKGRGRRLCKLIVPRGTPDIEVDEVDKEKTILIRR